MTSTVVELWLVAQMVIEVLLCSIIIYYVLRERNNRQGKRVEREKTGILIQSLDRLLIDSEGLEKKYHKLLKLLETIEKRGSALETSIDLHERRLPHSPVEKNREETGTAGINCYEKTLNLIEQGLPAGEIAQQVKLPRGEVELIMNLKEQ